MSDYQRALGERLRAIRGQQGLTLHDVQERSGGRWKSVVVGSYERGDRAVSVGKLAQLAGFYGVPVSELLPETTNGVKQAASDGRVVIDLTKLNTMQDPRHAPLSRFARTIQVQRGDFNGRVLTLRADDVRALAVVYGTTTDDLVVDLEDRGLLVN